MCGFSGEVRRDGRPADVGAVARMTATMHDRGPDGSGVWSQRNVALGHRRLKIVDLSEHASQPMVDAELGLTIAFNGMVYNYPQLREQLVGEGYRFFSTSDTEVVLKAYAHWGEDFVDHLVGMFACAIVERDSGRVVLARDRLGIKPLYLAEVPGALRFASTLPALLEGGGVDTSIDRAALHSYLSFHAVVPAPRTVLSGVRKLPAGHGAGRRARRHDPRPDVLAAAVHARPGEGRLVGRGLGGGGARRAAPRRAPPDGRRRRGRRAAVGRRRLEPGRRAARRAGPADLRTFSIGFDAVGGRSGDEFQYSDIVAQRFETKHMQLRVPPEDVLPALDRAVAAMAEPMVSHDVVAFYLLSQEVSKHVRVVQSGQGADEVFAGYHWYPPMLGADDPVATYAGAFFDRDDAGVRALLQPEWHADADESRRFVEEHFARPHADTPLDRALRLDTEVMLVDDPVKRVDNTTMAFGLEARVPFLDHELVELAAQCPPELKLAHGGKGVLKQAARRVIPSEVIDRPKGYFPVPALTHLEGGFLDRVRDALTSSAAKERGLFRPEVVDRLLADPNGSLTPLGGNPLWQLALLEMWLQGRGV